MQNLILICLCLSFSAWSSAANLDKSSRLIEASLAQTKTQVTYNGAYFKIPYPNGDIPAEFGVCTDVVIRAYRKLNIDLQQLVHEDMRKDFLFYPAMKMWGQHKTDGNIDHRRVPNLQTFFSRFGKNLPTSTSGKDYRPGDLVTWLVSGNLPHIGIVTDKQSNDGLRPLIVHNIGAGPQLEDMLFDYKITGHYRYGL